MAGVADREKEIDYRSEDSWLANMKHRDRDCLRTSFSRTIGLDCEVDLCYLAYCTT